MSGRDTKPEPVDLVILAGQSNAVGYDADAALLPSDESDGRVMFWWRCGSPPPDERDSSSAGAWTSLRAQPRGNPATPQGDFRFGVGFGPEMGFARTLAAEGRRLAIVKAAWNGTSLSADWNPDGGSSFRTMLEEVRLATEAARSAGIALRPRAFLWIQGESDAEPELACRYGDTLVRMLRIVREKLGAPDLAMLLGVNVHYGDLDEIRPIMADIVRSQKAVAERLGRSAYVDTDGASLANLTHFDAEGTLEIGRRFALALVGLERAAR